MSTNLDKSLDDIISSNPTRRVPRARKAVGVKKAAPKAKVENKRGAKSAVIAKAVAAETSIPTDKIIVSNLPTDIPVNAIKEYFKKEIGPIINCTMSYDQKGKSLGTVSIVFKREGDAGKAAHRFNNTKVDGKMTMKVELVMDISKKPLAARFNPKPVAVAKPAPKSKANKAKPAVKATPAAASKPKGKEARKRRPKKTMEQLDAEMADYFEAAPASAAAPAAPTGDIPM
ncbi:hypothetical protein NADFUDRAFT_82470 [Nadsonia fulvescens var. elongata DSM 6958]|uniref:RRM domain-containing protein n=1 Tax=Nadsonia fulvescens var. elongata DSM 6958 TaxID=857566 RepID=A0A1E3PN69_9ASCO|nr:hypothetical protein NADFUDRAFT_82470 [Nadsonia fulvescens var. elongata DSM 6958]